MLSLLFCSIISAHEINKYKYICIDVEQNPYDIETRFIEEFQKQGFLWINHNNYDTLDLKEKKRVLFAEYSYYLNYNGPSSITLLLKNAAGETVWSSRGEGCTLFSAKGDMKGATKNIMKEFKVLNYKFDESASQEPKIDHPFSTWTEDSIRTYLRTKHIAKIEGIYKNYSNNGDSYNIALLKDNDVYYGIVINTDNELWEAGDIKLILSYIDNDTYDVEFYNYNHKKLNALAILKDGRFLEITVPNGSNAHVYSLLRIYPSGHEKNSTSTSINSECRYTGSGIIFAENYLITNYHVVEDANRIEVILNINGINESFNAKVLCTDKTNDLAILSIKDEKYKTQTNIPFKISNNTLDVGTSVFTMGFPLTTVLGEEVKITDGIISSKTGFDGDIVTYQITAPIQPGNSGGPLFDKKGNLIGITNAGINSSITENVGYAIKSTYIYNLIDAAPINIPIPKGSSLPNENLPELIKILKPYVTLIKVY